jgi:hypothetical protein
MKAARGFGAVVVVLVLAAVLLVGATDEDTQGIRSGSRSVASNVADVARDHVPGLAAAAGVVGNLAWSVVAGMALFILVTLFGGTSVITWRRVALAAILGVAVGAVLYQPSLIGGTPA